MFTNGLVFGATLALAAACNADVVFDPLIDDDAPVFVEVEEGADCADEGSVIIDSFVEECGLLQDLSVADRLHNRDPFWFAGSEVTFMKVSSATGGRITLSFDDSGTAGTDIAFADGDGLDSFGLTPRVWVGRKFGEKWGVIGRYWRLGDSELRRPDLAPGNTPLTTFGTYEERDRVEAYTIDIEGLRTFRPGKWKIDTMCGARHLRYTTESSLLAFGVITTGNFANLTLQNDCQFDGTGVTFGVQGRRQLGDSPVYFFVGVRGTSAYGRSDSFGRSDGTVASSPSAPLVGAATVSRNNASARMEIIETQVGLDIEHQLRCCPAKAFFRAAFEYQYWELSGPPTGGAGFGGTIGTLTTNSFASAGLGDMKLLGLALSTGLTW